MSHARGLHQGHRRPSARRARRARPPRRSRCAAPSAPSRARRAAAESAASSSSLMPPSGPTTQHHRVRARRRPSSVSGASPTRAAPGPLAPAAGRRHRRRRPVRRWTPPADRRDVGRRDCRAADRATASSAAGPCRPWPTVPARHAPSDCQATNASRRPRWPARRRARTRSDLGSACTTVDPGRGRSTVRRSSTRANEAALREPSTTHSATVPAPSPRSSSSPGGSGGRWRRGIPRHRRRRRARRPSGIAST